MAFQQPRLAWHWMLIYLGVHRIQHGKMEATRNRLPLPQATIWITVPMLLPTIWTAYLCISHSRVIMFCLSITIPPIGQQGGLNSWPSALSWALHGSEKKKPQSNNSIKEDCYPLLWASKWVTKEGILYLGLQKHLQKEAKHSLLICVLLHEKPLIPTVAKHFLATTQVLVQATERYWSRSTGLASWTLVRR